MATGCIDLLLCGTLSWLFEKSHKKRNEEMDRVEIESHTWLGVSGKTRYNRRYLGPIQQKTFLSTSRQMVKSVGEYELILNKLLTDCSEYQNYEVKYTKLLELNKKIHRYLRQIDRRETLRCYSEWKSDHPVSFSAYQEARIIAIKLDSKLKKVKQKYDP